MGALFAFASLCALCLNYRSLSASEEKVPAATEPIRRVRVESTNLAALAYDAAGQVLEVEFRSGAVYRYFDVPSASYREFMTAPSKGRYFARHIRGKHRFVRIVVPRK